jgi:hypothetical protein
MGVYYGKADFITYGKPSLFLDFANKKSLVDRMSGNNLITFSRNSIGTYVGSDGLIKTASANEPRFDHDPLTGESLGLLVEEARTNLLPRSDQIGISPWGIRTNAGNSATVQQNALLSPDGLLTASKVTISRVANDFSGIFQDISTISGTYTFSAWMRLDNGVSDKSIQIHSGDLSNNRINVTLTSAWQRVTSTFTGGSYTYVGIGNWYSNLPDNWIGSTPFYIWGAQLEQGSFPTSYIPTTSTEVTRSADDASITGSNFSSWYNQSEGTVIWRGIFNNFEGGSGNSAVFSINDGTASTNRFSMRPQNTLATSSGNNMFGGWDWGYSNSKNTQMNIAFAIKSGNYALVASGVERNTSSSASVPVVDRITSFNSFEEGLISNVVHHKQLIYYPTRLTDAQLQSITS